MVNKPPLKFFCIVLIFLRGHPASAFPLRFGQGLAYIATMQDAIVAVDRFCFCL